MDLGVFRLHDDFPSRVRVSEDPYHKAFIIIGEVSAFRALQQGTKTKKLVKRLSITTSEVFWKQASYSLGLYKPTQYVEVGPALTSSQMAQEKGLN